MPFSFRAHTTLTLIRGPEAAEEEGKAKNLAFSPRSASDGVPVLPPRAGEGLRILGCLFDSPVWPGHRAPPGKALLRAKIGGALDPAAAELDDTALLAAARADLEKAMGLRDVPERQWVFRFPRGIPQYETGHGRRVDEASALLPA